MPLINIAPTEPCSIPELSILSLRFLYEEKKMSMAEVNLMKFSVNYYANLIRERNEKRAERYIITEGDEERHQSEQEIALTNIAQLLVRIETGTLDAATKRSVIMARVGLFDWRKKHNIPGARTKESFEEAQLMYEKYKRENPEQEDMSAKKK